MINGRKVLAVISARGGSKGVPRKNIRTVGGKPLIAWTIEAARSSRYIDRLIISSDDAEIIAIARQWGCEAPFVRPAELASDDTPGVAPVLHAIETLPEKYDYVVLLQPTSPLRTAADIDGCLEHCLKYGAPSCVSVTEAQENPHWMYSLDTGNQLKPVMDPTKKYLRRQDLPALYVLNGAVYVNDCGWLTNTRSLLTDETLGYVMPRARSLDVDSEEDLAWLDWLFAHGSAYSKKG